MKIDWFDSVEWYVVDCSELFVWHPYFGLKDTRFDALHASEFSLAPTQICASQDSPRDWSFLCRATKQTIQSQDLLTRETHESELRKVDFIFFFVLPTNWREYWLLPNQGSEHKFKVTTIKPVCAAVFHPNVSFQRKQRCLITPREKVTSISKCTIIMLMPLSPWATLGKLVLLITCQSAVANERKLLCSRWTFC